MPLRPPVPLPVAAPNKAAQSWAVAATAAVAEPPAIQFGGWQGFSSLVDACERDGLLSASAAAALRRLGYVCADTVRLFYAEQAMLTGTAAPAGGEGDSRLAFLQKAQIRLEAAAMEAC
jgi:hypothetical protein